MGVERIQQGTQCGAVCRHWVSFLGLRHPPQGWRPVAVQPLAGQEITINVVRIVGGPVGLGNDAGSRQSFKNCPSWAAYRSRRATVGCLDFSPSWVSARRTLTAIWIGQPLLDKRSDWSGRIAVEGSVCAKVDAVLHGLMSLPMTCVGCGFEILADFAFCPRCGRRQSVACASCGFVCDPDFAFCPRCGSPREPAAAAEARSHEPRPTAARSPCCSPTSPASPRWPNASTPKVRAFQNALFEHARPGHRALRRLRREVRRRCGDGGVRRAGRARGRPVRALEAALDMLRRATGSAPVGGAPRPAGQLHIGVHTGPVVAGSLGGGAGGTYAVTGDTVNTASRLLAGRAGHGAGVGSDPRAGAASLRLRAGRRAGAARQGASRCAVHRLLGARAEPRPPRAGSRDLGLAAPLVGRGRRARPAAARPSTACSAAEAQVVSVVGEAGAGKSRLLAEFFARLERDGRLAGDRRAPRHLLVARRADLRHLRRAVPRGLPRRAGRFARGGPAASCSRACGRSAPTPTRPRRSRRC